MNYSAIRHRSAWNECYAYDENSLEINLRSGKDITGVNLVWEDPYAFREQAKGVWNGGIEKMRLEYSLENQSIWNSRIEPPFKRALYRFEIFSGEEKILLFENGFASPEEFEAHPDRYVQFKMAWMNSSDIARIPSWVKDTVWYQIFPDRFCSGGNHFKRFINKEWGDDKEMTYGDYFGGDLAGITSKIEYLKDLGISGIYLTPVFLSDTNHKYATIDWTKLDPDFGTEEEMAELVKTAHKAGIKVMLDAVFNHSGTEFAFWKDVVKNGESSAYKDWFFVNKFPVDDSSKSTSDGRYFTFDFYHRMPKLNTNNPEVQDYFSSICKSWIAKWNIDGIRFDVGNEISHSFVKKLHRELLEVKPDLYLLGEIWGDSIQWLTGDEYHSVMNYPFMTAVNNFFENAKAEQSYLKESMDYVASLYYRQTKTALFNILDTHDTVRLIDSCANLNQFYQKLAVLMTFQGSPCVYYGTEVALNGKDGPYNRRCMPWKRIARGEYAEIQNTVKKIIAVRNMFESARAESIEYIKEANPRLIHYEKKSDGRRETLTVYLNASDRDEEVKARGRIIFENNSENDSANNKIIIKAGGILMEIEKDCER